METEKYMLRVYESTVPTLRGFPPRGFPLPSSILEADRPTSLKLIMSILIREYIGPLSGPPAIHSMPSLVYEYLYIHDNQSLHV